MKYEAKKHVNHLLETLNIEWGQFDTKGNRRVNFTLIILIALCL